MNGLDRSFVSINDVFYEFQGTLPHRLKIMPNISWLDWKQVIVAFVGKGDIGKTSGQIFPHSFHGVQKTKKHIVRGDKAGGNVGRVLKERNCCGEAFPVIKIAVVYILFRVNQTIFFQSIAITGDTGYAGIVVRTARDTGDVTVSFPNKKFSGLKG